jgi:antitoxin HicB
MTYYCKLDPDSESGGYTVTFPDVSGAITEGDTVDEALFNAAEALNGVLESDLVRGYGPPPALTGPDKGLYPIEVAPHIVVAWEIRRLRGDRTQAEIAARLGLSYQAYQRLENPRKGNPTVKTLERIARALGKKLEISIA